MKKNNNKTQSHSNDFTNSSKITNKKSAKNDLGFESNKYNEKNCDKTEDKSENNYDCR